MKKLINQPDTVVRDMLEGVVALTPGSSLLPDDNVLLRTDVGPAADRKVAVLSGGGSGHEPAHAGYVGAGMLTAAIAGDVFTSPSTDAVLNAIRAVSGPAGAVLIVKNYTGDRLNFGLAAELARAEGFSVEVVIVADDVALRETVTKERRRGIAGTVLVHKIAGAAAEAGMELAEVARLARLAADNIGSMGISLGSCTLPAVGRPGFVLGELEIEVGLGIHGEQGVRRTNLLPANDLTELVIQTMAADQPFAEGERLVLLVNGLGATPPLELSIVCGNALRQLEGRGLNVERAWVGTFLSALDMPGFSLSVMRIDDELLRLLDASTSAIFWPGPGKVNHARVLPAVEHRDEHGGIKIDASPAAIKMQQIVARAATAAIAAEQELTELDSIAGDGDLGASMKRGGEAILSLDASSFESPSDGMAAIGNSLRRAIAGSSGPFYATALLRASRRLAGTSPVSASDWASAFSLAVQAICDLGGAKPGDRTMIDALYPAAETFRMRLKAGDDLHQAWEATVAAAVAGADATKSMAPRLGRASYLGERAIGHPDGGAVAVSIWLKAITFD